MTDAPTTYATPEAVAVLLGRAFSTAELAQCQGFLNDAEAQIRLKFPTLDDLISERIIAAETVALVEVRAARRVMLNPDAKQNERIDDYSYGRTGVVAESEVVITDEDWALLAPSESTSDSYSVRMSNAGPGYRDVRNVAHSRRWLDDDC
jgi:hypothetical protein